MSTQFYNLKVSNITRETSDAVSVTFDIPSDLKEQFQFTQGQYLTLRFKLKNQEVRRAYSMSSSPLDNRTTVTVKQIKDGLVSTHINTAIKVGDEIAVMPPQGRFFTKLNPDQQKTYYLFGGGSGITPLMSILKTIVEKEPMSAIFLLYGNQNENSIIFKEELAELEKKYAGQLMIEHILSDPIREKPKGFGAFLKRGKITWQGEIGLANGTNAGKFLDKNPPRAKDVEYFICGPGPMMDSIEGVLLGRGIDKKTIHLERFSSTPTHEQKAGKASSDGITGKVKVHLDGEVLEITVGPSKTILDALLDIKKEPPYSCTSGSCSTCMAVVKKGTVKMDACYALDDDEVEEGYILTCQAHPTSPDVEITFDL